jgi:hypothetical protein
VIVSGEAEAIKENPDGTMEKLSRLAAGDIYGEMALLEHKPRSAHVIARTVVTCIVFSPGEPTAFAGRGANAALTDLQMEAVDTSMQGITTSVDVSAFIHQKIRAVASHRTQYPIEPDMFPESMLIELFGREYFVRVHPPAELDDKLI